MNRGILLLLIPLLVLSPSISAFITNSFVAPTNDNSAAVSVNYFYVNASVTTNDTTIPAMSCDLGVTYPSGFFVSYSMNIGSIGNDTYCYLNITGLTAIGVYKYDVNASNTVGEYNDTGNRSVSINICGIVSTNTTLNASVYQNGGTCFTITGADTRLDCGKYVVNGTGSGNAVIMSNARQRLSNCIITGWSNAISLLAANYSIVSKNDVYGNSIALTITNTNNASVTQNNFTSTSAEVNMSKSDENYFTRDALRGTLTSFTMDGSNLRIITTDTVPIPLPYSFQNATTFFTFSSSDPNAWCYMNMTYSNDMLESSLGMQRDWFTIWVPVVASQDNTNNVFFKNFTTFASSVYAIMGCSNTRPLYYGGICYAAIDVGLVQQPDNYVIGDLVNIQATLSDPTLESNVTDMQLYYANSSGGSYLVQNLVHNPIDHNWFGVFLIRQHSELIQVMAIDNTTGAFAVVGYGSFTLTENQPTSWFNWFVIFAAVIIGLLVIIFLGKWIWDAI